MKKKLEPSGYPEGFFMQKNIIFKFKYTNDDFRFSISQPLSELQ